MRKNNLILLIVIIKAQLLLAFQSPNLNHTEGETTLKLNQSSAKYITNNQLIEAENDATAALELARAENSTLGIAHALDNLGLIARAKFDYTNAMNYFVEALKLKESVSNKCGVAESKNHIGRVFYLQNNNNQALGNYQAALDLLDNNVENLPTIAETHRNLGDVYLSQKFYGKAIDEFDKALKIWSQDLQDFPRAASLASFLGKVNFDIKDSDGALNNFNASLNFHRMLNDVVGCANDFLELSRVYNGLNDNDLAIANAGNALSAFKQISNPTGMAEANCLLGKIYLKNNNTTLAASFFEQSATILRGVTFQPAMPVIYKSIAEGYLKMGNTAKAYEYLSDYATSKDSLFNNEKNRSLVEMTTKYESEFAVKDKNRQLAAFEKAKTDEKRLRWLLIGLVGLSLVALWLTFRNYRLKKADNKKLAVLNAQIQNQNEAIVSQNDALERVNSQLSEKNEALDLLNGRLIEEVSERENAQNEHFSKDNYLADVSSRMRDPLSIMVNEARMLMLEEPRKDQEEHVKHLQFATNNLLVLINDVLNFSNIEAGKLTLSHQDFETHQIFEQIKEGIKAKPNVTFESHIDSQVPVQLKGDSVRLVQILYYITTGLQRQLDSGTIKLEILHKSLIGNELTLKINIIANGKIIKNELLSEILRRDECRDLFKDLSSNDMEWLTARRLIELQNGSIQFLDQENRLELSVYLPFKMVETIGEKVTDTEGVPIWANNNFLEGKRVLIVEDNKVNQMLVANMLKKRDVVVRTANDGLEALEVLETKDFDLILMDIQMPRMDGYRAVAEIRRLKNVVKSEVPIIALTASAYINEKEKAQLFGMTDYIGKPFSPDELLEKVVRVLMSSKVGKEKEVVSVI